MSTRSSARNLYTPLDNAELTIRRRSRDDPTLLNDFEMAAEGNSDILVPDLRTMEELCPPSLNGRVAASSGSCMITPLHLFGAPALGLCQHVLSPDDIPLLEILLIP
nr:hypothetical protein [Tanacetum cinerariifolium]